MISKTTSRRIIPFVLLILISPLKSEAPPADLYCFNCVAGKCEKQASGNYKCTQCEDKFGLKDPTSNECKICEDHFVVDPTTKQCKECEVQQISENGSCKSCTKTEVQRNNKCIKCQERQIRNNNNCQDCPTGSIVKSGEDKCSECEERKIQVGNQCVECKEREIKDTNNKCIPCDKDKIQKNNVCTACKAGEYVKDNTCVKCTGRAYVKDNECVLCKENEKLKMTGDQITGCDPCPRHFIRVIVNEKDDCKECKVNEISIADTNKCEPVKDNQIQVENKAINCDPKQFVKDNKCVSCGENCQRCKKETAECETCISGRFGKDLADKTKMKCSICEDSNCESCPDDHKKCSLCLPGTTNNGGIGCMECKDNCKKCSTKDNCFECFPGMVLQGNSCFPSQSINNKNSQCSRNCLKCSSYATCDVCFDGYFVNRNKNCQKCAYNCVKCNSEVDCMECQIGHSLKEGTCVVHNNFDKSWPWMLAIGGIALLAAMGYLCYHFLSKSRGVQSGRGYVQMPETGNSYNPHFSNYNQNRYNPNINNGNGYQQQPMSPPRDSGLSQYIGF